MPKCIEHLKAIQHSLFGLHPVHYCLHALSGIYIESGCQSVTSTLHLLHLASSQHPSETIMFISIHFPLWQKIWRPSDHIRPHVSDQDVQRWFIEVGFVASIIQILMFFLVWCENSNTPGASNGATDNGLRQLVARLDGPLARNEVVTNKPFKSWRWNNMD